MTLGTFLLLILFPEMFEQSRADPVFLVKSLLFIPFDIGGGVIQPLMRIGWTVNCEIFFYVVFLIALQISHKYRGLICAALLAMVMAAALLLPSCPIPLAFYGSPVMLEFIFGIISYYAAWGLYQLRQAKKLPSVCMPVSALILIGSFVTLVLTKPSINILGFRRPFVWGLPALIIVSCSFILGLYLKDIPRPIVRLGDASFSLYLVHYYPVMLLDRAVFDFSACTPFTIFGAVAAMAVSICLALASWRILEQAFAGWLRRQLTS